MTQYASVSKSLDDLTDLKLRDETTVAYTLEVASNGDGGTAMAADRTLKFDVYNADRTIDMQGNISLAGNLTTAGAFTTSGAYGVTLTATGTTSVTLPTSGTLPSYLEVSGEISAAQIKGLNGTPIEAIAAPGASKAIIVEEVQLFLDYVSAGYAADANEDLQVRYSGGSVVASIDNDAVTFLTATADAHWFGGADQLYTVGAAAAGDGVLLSDFDNEAVQFYINTGEVITGDSPIKYRIRYRVVDFLS